MMKTLRLYTLWAGFPMFILSLFFGEPMDSLLISMPKPFGLNYSLVMSLTGILMFVCSMFSSWVADSIKTSEVSEEEELGTIILKNIAKFVFEIVIISFIDLLIEALLDPS